MRDTNNFVDFPDDVIVDGQIINAGETIGSALVLAVQPTIIGNRYEDTENLQCGTSYTYRVYAYRFAIDDQLGEAPDTTSRGRQYAPAFGTSEEITKPNPPQPEIIASRLAKCPGDTVTLRSSLTGDYDYDWRVDGAPVNVPGTTEIVVEAEGTYTLTITAPGGCFSTSNSITITSLPAPRVNVVPRGLQQICDGESITLTATTTAPGYQWLRNGSEINGATSDELVVTTPGEYRCRVETSDGCPGLSSVVTVSYYDVSFDFAPPTLDLGQLGECQNSASATTWLRNTGEEAITVSDIQMPTDFALVFPAPGFQVAPGDSVEVTIRFAPSGVGLRTDVATFTATPCDVAVDLNVRGERTTALVSLDKAGVDYGVYTACPTSDIRADSAFVITNLGSEPITVRAPLLAPPFYLLNGFTSVDLGPGEDFEIRILYRPLGPDLDRGVTADVAFPFTSVSCNDTLRASLQAASFAPKPVVEEDDIDVGIVLGCIGTADTLVTIVNNSPVETTITSNVSANIQLSGLPITIPPGESRSVRAVVTPPGAGAFTMNDTLLVNECGIRLPLEFSGSVFSPSFEADPESIDLPDVLLCAGQAASSATFTLRASGTNGLRAPILAVDVSEPFSVDLEAGRTIIDSLTVTVTYTPTIDGADVDTVIVVFGPCNDTVRCVVRGATASSSRTTTIDDADFGLINNGQASQRLLVITNTGTAPIDVEALTGVTPPWSITSSNPALPATLQPAETAEVVLEYSYLGPDRDDQLEIVSTTSAPCADTVSFTLTGRTAPQGILGGITVDVEDQTRVQLGQTASIPVALTSRDPLTGAGLSQYTVYVSYNGTLFKAEDATSDVATVVVTETQPGRAEIDVSYATEADVADPAFTITGQTYLGSARSTPITVDSVRATGFSIDGDDGELILDGDCVIETQVISLGEPPSITARQDGSDVKVTFTTISDKPTTLVVSDLQGAEVRRVIVEVEPGTHIATLQLPAVSSGAYMVTMLHDLVVKSTSMIISR